MDRNRTIQKIHEYWQSRQRGNLLPSRADILPGELRDFLPFLFMADVSRLPVLGTGINLRLVGTHIGRVLGIDLTGAPAGGIARHWRDFSIARDLFEAADQRCAIVTTHEFRADDAEGPPFLHYHRVVLPLSRDGRQVDHILGALVAETHVHDSAENARLWQAPYIFSEHGRRILTRPRSGNGYHKTAPTPAGGPRLLKIV